MLGSAQVQNLKSAGVLLQCAFNSMFLSIHEHSANLVSVFSAGKIKMQQKINYSWTKPNCAH